MTTPRATIQHARRLGYCARGLRRWFEGRDVTYHDFITHGVPVDWLRACDDAMASALADLVEREHT